MRRAFPPDLGQRLTGARVIGLGRRAKFGLIGTDRGDTLVFHLGMSGHWRIDPPALDVHDHLLIETDDGRRLALNDARRFGSVDLVATDALADWPPFAALGPDALSPLDGAWFKRRFAGRRGPVKPLLLDQRIIAGLGNIYACEALHRARHPPGAGRRIDRGRPARPAGRGDSRSARRGESRRAARRCAISPAPTATLGYFSKSFAVYGREGQPCACGGTVRRIVQGGRSTFYCPRCQR